MLDKLCKAIQDANIVLAEFFDLVESAVIRIQKLGERFLIAAAFFGGVYLALRLLLH